MSLIGNTGMTKNSVMKRMPCFLTNVPTVPQLPQRICPGTVSDPQVKKCVPIMKKKEITRECQAGCQ